MADPRPGTHNGPPHAVPDSGAHAAQPPAAAPFSRPFTLYEALPYTPFSSIAPFDSGRFRGHTCDTRRHPVGFNRRLTFHPNSTGVLPPPSIGSASPAPPLTDLVPGFDFAALNQEAAAQNPPSKRFQQALSQVQHLLERGNIPEL